MPKFFLKAICIVFLIGLNTSTLYAQKKKNKQAKDTVTDEYFQDNYMRLGDYTYKTYIKSVQFHRIDWQYAPPILKLNAGQQLQLDFDDLTGDSKTYNYTLIHCNADWQQSNLFQQEYMGTFFDDVITNIKFSFNTLQKYTHYNFVFPNNNIQITKSGNYILKVYENYDANKIVITKRFMVYDEKVQVNGFVKQGTINLDRMYKHEIDFTLNTQSYNLTNPYSSDLNIVLMQNGRWDNAKQGLKPTFVKDKELIYDYDEDNVFAGSNEFRRFDTKSIRYHSERVKDVVLDSALKRFKVQLLPDVSRAHKKYVFDNDINGHYLVKIQEGSDSDIDADYAYVSFFLSASNPYLDGDIYIFGELSEWQYKPEFKMKYNYERYGYECTVLLKQGYYNYNYVFLKTGDKVADDTVVEGMHFEAENDYMILVYHREFGSTWDQLVAVKFLNSAR
jgi:hypothetical protein